MAPAPAVVPESLAPAPAVAVVTPERNAPAAAVDRAVLVPERDRVLRTLHEYEQAFEGLNVTATAEVWPSVDRRALTRAFATLKSQGLNFDLCEVQMLESTATARCDGTVQFVRRVGSQVPLTAQQHWVFRMRKFGNEWMIEEVTASPRTAAETRARGES